MRIANGKRYFYQWEKNQKLEVPENCNIVFFSNGTKKDAWGIDVVDGFVPVPDELLWTAADLHCYGWDDATTTVIIHAVFRVEPMAKPEKYAYTPTEVKRYDDILKKLEEKGAYYIPSVDADGNLTWKKSLDQMPDVPGSNIKGPKGDRGERGPKGDPGSGGGSGALNDDQISKEASWSSQKTVDKLCPSFAESGSVVVCEPVEGYPLRVSTYLPTDHGVSKITLYHEGIDEEDSREYTVDFGEAFFDGYYDWETGELHTTEEGTLQFSPQVITAFSGRNSFRSDCGDTFVGGMADPNNYWAEKLAEQEAIIAEQEAQLAAMNKQYELIEECTLKEDTTIFERPIDTEGDPYNFRAVAIFIDVPAYAAAAASDYIIINLRKADGTHLYYYEHTGVIATNARKFVFKAWNDCGLAEAHSLLMQGSSSVAMQSELAYASPLWGNVARIRISAPKSPMPLGTKITIYGIRG